MKAVESQKSVARSRDKKTHHSSLRYSKLWIGIAVLILISPLGLILPEIFNARGAWGEWGIDEIAEWMEKEGITEYIPEGLKRLSEIWSAPIPDYAFSGWDSGIKRYIAYILSGVIGVLIVIVVSYMLGRLLKPKD